MLRRFEFHSPMNGRGRFVWPVIGALGLGVLGLGVTAIAAQQQSSPIARYTMDAGTISGFGAIGGVSGAMAMLTGRSSGAAHELELRLGSSRTASGEPKADHFMPVGAALGKSVPLITPIIERGEAAPTPGQLPKARLLIYWGCGEHAPKGQPLVIDFAKLAKGQVPPGLYAQGLDLPEDWRVSPSNSRTYGSWPNAKDPKNVPAKASLIGAHRIASSYAPEIDFSLDRTFMPALQTRSAQLPSGAFSLNWNAVPDATGYYAWVMAAKTDGPGEVSEMVWWASSATQQFGGPMWDWISPAAASKLIAAQTVMPPSQTSCTVPAEVKQAGGDVMMANLYAYGPQRDFAYPPRPADIKVAWQPEWTARVRFRSREMFILGMPGMGDLGRAGDDSEAADPQGQTATQGKKPKCKGLAGIAKRAAGLCE